MAYITLTDAQAQQFIDDGVALYKVDEDYPRDPITGQPSETPVITRTESTIGGYQTADYFEFQGSTDWISFEYYNEGGGRDPITGQTIDPYYLYPTLDGNIARTSSDDDYPVGLYTYELDESGYVFDISQADLDLFNDSGVVATVDGVEVTQAGSYNGEALVLSSQYEITSASYGEIELVLGTSGDLFTATATQSLTGGSFTLEIDSSLYPDSFNSYKVNKYQLEELMQYAIFSGEEYFYLYDFIYSINVYPYDLDAGEATPIKFGSHETDSSYPRYDTQTVKLNLGGLSFPASDSYLDVVDTELLIYPPYHDPFKVDYDLVQGRDIVVWAFISVASRKTLVQVEDINGQVLATEDMNLGTSMPVSPSTYQGIVGDYSVPSAINDNPVLYAQIIKPDYPEFDNQYNLDVTVYEQIAAGTGFAKVEELPLGDIPTAEEIDIIETILKRGVYL